MVDAISLFKTVRSAAQTAAHALEPITGARARRNQREIIEAVRAADAERAQKPQPEPTPDTRRREPGWVAPDRSLAGTDALRMLAADVHFICSGQAGHDGPAVSVEQVETLLMHALQLSARRVQLGLRTTLPYIGELEPKRHRSGIGQVLFFRAAPALLDQEVDA